jgi:hypothetical protein
MQLRTTLRLFLLISLLAILVVLMGRLVPTSVGTSDFIGYWACARLLFLGQDPYDADNILQTQREAYPDRAYPMYSWNPPWSCVLLLPLGALPFPQATTTWLLVNLLLIAASSLGAWWLFDGQRSSSAQWIALPIAFLFAQTLTVLDTGQITTFMLVGVTGFLVAFKLHRDMLAGASLALVTIKPHLVFLWLPLVFLWTLDTRRWRVWLGFALALAISLIVLTVFLPSWPQAYSAILDSPPINWATPTLGGLMAIAWGENWARFLGLLFLPAVILLWWKTRHCSPELVTAGLLPISLALAAFGWSYDQILLLLPIMAIVVSLVRRQLPPREAWITAALLGIFAIALFVQRTRAANEFHYLWVPWAVLLIGAWTAWRYSQAHRRSRDGETVSPDALDGAIR